MGGGPTTEIWEGVWAAVSSGWAGLLDRVVGNRELTLELPVGVLVSNSPCAQWTVCLGSWPVCAFVFKPCQSNHPATAGLRSWFQVLLQKGIPTGRSSASERLCGPSRAFFCACGPRPGRQVEGEHASSQPCFTVSPSTSVPALCRSILQSYWHLRG